MDRKSKRYLTALSARSVLSALVAVVTAAVALVAACGRDAATPDSRLEKLEPLGDRVEDLDKSQGVTSSSSALVTSVLLSAVPSPTPNPANSPWIETRFNALIQRYDFTGQGGGRAATEFGPSSNAGRARVFRQPRFPRVCGSGRGQIHQSGPRDLSLLLRRVPRSRSPELSWGVVPGRELTPAMERYHADILSFMEQPSDGFELFRRRLRDLPEIFSENPEPLFHIFGSRHDLWDRRKPGPGTADST